MTRRRKITLTILITAGALAIAGSAATATALVLQDDPAEQHPAAFEPTPEPTNSSAAPTPASTYPSDLIGLGACHDLFRDDMLIHVALLARQTDNATATQWVDDVHRIARSAERADTADVSRAAEQVDQTILDASGSPLGDVIDVLLDGETAPVNELMLACVAAGLVEPEDVQRFADSALGG